MLPLNGGSINGPRPSASRSAARPLRLALLEVVSAEDELLRRQWTGIVAVTPGVLPGVIGGIQLKTHRVIAAFLADRLGVDDESMVAVTLAAAAGGVIQAAHTRWFVHGGQLATRISDGIEILEATLTAPPVRTTSQAGGASRQPSSTSTRQQRSPNSNESDRARAQLK